MNNKRPNRVREVQFLPPIRAVADFERIMISDPLKSHWRAYLDTLAPSDISTTGEDDINDAYRHYMSAAELSRYIGSYLALTLGNLNELINRGYKLKATAMDYANNDAGAIAGSDSDSGMASAIHFVTDVATGKVVMLDEKTGEPRAANIHDISGYNGTPLENKYIPDKSGDGSESMQA